MTHDEKPTPDDEQDAVNPPEDQTTEETSPETPKPDSPEPKGTQDSLGESGQESEDVDAAVDFTGCGDERLITNELDVRTEQARRGWHRRREVLGDLEARRPGAALGAEARHAQVRQVVLAQLSLQVRAPATPVQLVLGADALKQVATAHCGT